MNSDAGKVYLVGAGPGDPGLITVRGTQVLAQADLVLYDGLVNPLLLSLTAGECVRTARTRSGDHAIIPQNEINARLISEARSGKTVVRLKGGDPYVFGRGSEEARALSDAGIAFEIVPGITAATAAGVYAGFSFTHRDHSSAVAFITGHETPDREVSHLNYLALAKFPGTLVFYMGLARVGAICRSLIQAGKPKQTPASVISHASLPDQRVVSGVLADLPEKAQLSGLRAPSLIVIGECVNQRDAGSWFESLPLFGRRIGITRAVHQAGSVIDAVVRGGGQPVLLPLIDILPPDATQRQEFTRIVRELDGFHWLIFSSANGVQAFMEQLWADGRDARALRGLKIAAIGPSTAAELESWSLRADVVPATSVSEELAKCLLPQVAKKRCLLAGADRSRQVLPKLLTDAEATVEHLVVYRHVDRDLSEELRQQLIQNPLDWIGLSSPAIARQTAVQLPQLVSADCPTRVVTISSLTSRAAREAGLTVTAEAASASWDSMLAAIAQASR